MRGIRAASAARLVLLLVVASSPPGLPSVLAATGETLETGLGCPDSVAVDAFPRLDLHLENVACEPQTVRVLSVVVGNGDETVGGVEILGPVVARQGATVPAATDNLSGVCTANQCEGSTLWCSSNLDCICRMITPGVADFEIVIPTALPAAFGGTVVEQFIFTDKTNGTKVTSDSCLISVPEPAAALQLAVALTTVALLRNCIHRLRNRREDST
jgi:hypothetical protein